MAQPVVTPIDPNAITDEQALAQFQQNITQVPTVKQPVMTEPQQMVMPEEVPAALAPNTAVVAPEITQPMEQPADPFEKYLKGAEQDVAAMGQQRYDQLYQGIQVADQTLQQRIAADRAAGVSPEGIRNKYALDLADLQKREQELRQLGDDLVASTPQKEVTEVDQIAAEEEGAAMAMAEQSEIARLQAEQLAMNAESRKQGQQQAKQIAQAEGAKGVQNLAEQTEKRIQETDEYVARSLPEIMQKGTLGQKLGAALAVIAGGVAQGMLKLNSNPALDVINKEVDRYAAQQKLKADEREALRKQALTQTKMTLEERIGNSQILMNNAKVVEALGQLDLKAAEAGQKQQELTMLSQINSGQGVSSVAAQMLPKEYRERMVSMPGSSQQVLAVNKDAANKLREFTNEVGPAINGIDRILEFTNSDEFSRLNPKARVQVATEIQSLVGQLRIPLTGPGVLTDTEYERLLDTVGQPNKLLSLPAWERTKLNTVKNKLQSDIRSRYKNAGIDLPRTPQEQMFDRMKEKFPGMSTDAIMNAINKQMK